MSGSAKGDDTLNFSISHRAGLHDDIGARGAVMGE